MPWPPETEIRNADLARRRVLVNVTGAPVEVAHVGVTEVASDGVGEGQSFSGVLTPDQAVVLR